MRMKIVIDGRMYQESGVGRYIRNLLDQLQRLDKKNEYFILHIQSDYDRLVYHNNFHKVLADFRWYGINEQLKLPWIIKKIKPDLVHSPHFNVAIFFNDKFVVTIHDLIHQHFQMRRATAHDSITYKLKQFGYNTVFKNTLNKAEKILVPSNYVKDLLLSEWKAKDDKIVVTPEAVDDKLVVMVNNLSQKKSWEVLKKFNIKLPYLFYVGNAHPHKNVEGLIGVFLKLKGRYPDLSLVLSGHDHYFWQRVKEENQDSGIIYTGYVTDEQLVALYKNAKVFVMPSFEEGFGIPLLESMACSCPVVSSNVGALPEVGGHAAVYFNPRDRRDMGNKIDRVLNDESLRKELVKRGQKRVKLFSWGKLAKQTMEVYLQCV